MEGEFRIGECFVQPELNRITGPDGETQLEPKAMEVLVYLAQHAGKVLPKERIIRAVWPDTFVTDDVLIYAVSMLRKAFGEDARKAQVIETMAKGGYRLAETVEFEMEPAEADPAEVRQAEAASPAARAEVDSYAGADPVSPPDSERPRRRVLPWAPWPVRLLWSP